MAFVGAAVNRVIQKDWMSHWLGFFLKRKEWTWGITRGKKAPRRCLRGFEEEWRCGAVFRPRRMYVTLVAFPEYFRHLWRAWPSQILMFFGCAIFRTVKRLGLSIRLPLSCHRAMHTIENSEGWEGTYFSGRRWFAFLFFLWWSLIEVW